MRRRRRLPQQLRMMTALSLLLNLGYRGRRGGRLAHRRGRCTARQPKVDGALALALLDRCKLGWRHFLRVTAANLIGAANAIATAAVEVIVESFSRLFHLNIREYYQNQH